MKEQLETVPYFPKVQVETPVDEVEKPILRVATAGSVDDGKSTLIGRLFYDANDLADDQRSYLEKKARARGKDIGEVDLAALTDGLKSEQEQGITIDVAYRYFSTGSRHFILADTPGHEQYTRNMATGASTADCAIVMVDAKNGLTTQTRRHFFIASLLGVRTIIFAINKMDAIDYSQFRYGQIVKHLKSLLASSPRKDVAVHFIPVSALKGDNVVFRSANMPWYDGVPLLQTLEKVETNASSTRPFRMPVQYVLRPNAEFRGFAGRIQSGQIKVGDRIKVLPSGTVTTVHGLELFGTGLTVGQPGQSLTITADDEVDVSRGDLIVAADDPLEGSTEVTATVVWLSDRESLAVGKTYLVKHGARTVRAEVKAIHGLIEMDSYVNRAATSLALNEVGSVTFQFFQPVYAEPYAACRKAGALILVDAASFGTVGAAMIETLHAEATAKTAKFLEGKESVVRSLAKTVTWRLGGTLSTAIVVLIFTGQWQLAATVSAVEAVLKMALYYFHERFWDKVPLGRRIKVADSVGG